MYAYTLVMLKRERVVLELEELELELVLNGVEWSLEL